MKVMATRGRAFASAALLMVLAQFLAVCAVPLGACALSPAAAHRASVECCPAGSHPPGQCPLHRNDSHSNQCRMTCARQSATPFLPGMVGVMPPSIAVATAADVATPVVVLDPIHVSSTLTPSSPPPKTTA